jgi:hypothetical protein
MAILSRVPVPDKDFPAGSWGFTPGALLSLPHLLSAFGTALNFASTPLSQ